MSIEFPYYKRFPNFYEKGVRYHHELFSEFRYWLEDNVGEQKHQWDWVPGNIHAYGIVFLRGEDLTAFTLKFEI